jgi:hypothetical protein
VVVKSRARFAHGVDGQMTKSADKQKSAWKVGRKIRSINVLVKLETIVKFWSWLKERLG